MNQRKNPILAAILSFIIAGLGQLYIRRFYRATAFFLLEIITSYTAFSIHLYLGSLLNLLVSIIAAYDAYKIAKEINKGIKPERENSKEEKVEDKNKEEVFIY